MDEENGRVVVGTRDTAALLTRNVHIRSGNNPIYDEASGVGDQMYGWTIGVLGGKKEPKPGWHAEMPHFSTRGQRTLACARPTASNHEGHADAPPTSRA